MEPSYDLVERFWTPISQIIPVLALAYVVEFRAFSRGLTFEARGWRIYHGVLGVVLAVFMFFTEIIAIQSMAFNLRTEFWVYPVVWASGLMLAPLILNPVFALALKSNADLSLMLRYWMPWSRLRKAYRHSLRLREEKFKLAVEYRRSVVGRGKQVETIRHLSDVLRSQITRTLALNEEARALSTELAGTSGLDLPHEPDEDLRQMWDEWDRAVQIGDIWEQDFLATRERSISILREASLELRQARRDRRDGTARKPDPEELAIIRSYFEELNPDRTP